MTYSPAELPLSRILLDPNNYRFRDEGERRRIASHRYGEATVQAKASEKLRADGLSELKQSIVSNGFVPVERIVVRKWTGPRAADDGADAQVDEGAEAENELFVVVEGNRRTAVLKWLQEDADAGIDVPERVQEVFDAVPVVILESIDDADYLAIMGIRHVGGIKEWGGYQSARLIYELRHDHELSAQDVGSRLALTAVEVNRRYRAYQAMQQMKTSEEYSEYVAADLYPLFHEALVAPKTREWLGWSDENWQADNAETREQFYALLSPFTDGGGKERDPKIQSYSEVREIKSLLDNPEAMESLVDLEKPFSEAISYARSADANRNWLTKVVAATSALDHMGIRESKRLTKEQIEKLVELSDLLRQLIDTANESLEANHEAADSGDGVAVESVQADATEPEGVDVSNPAQAEPTPAPSGSGAAGGTA
jgi:hypothetical protein